MKKKKKTKVKADDLAITIYVYGGVSITYSGRVKQKNYSSRSPNTTSRKCERQNVDILPRKTNIRTYSRELKNKRA